MKSKEKQECLSGVSTLGRMKLGRTSVAEDTDGCDVELPEISGQLALMEQDVDGLELGHIGLTLKSQLTRAEDRVHFKV